jgi:hypothetical protein
MKYLSTAAIGVCAMLMGGSLGFAHESAPGLLNHSEMRAYRACLYEAWIEDYCHENSMRLTATYERVYASCVSANRGWRFPLAGRTVFNTDDYCWAAAHGLVRSR